MWIKSNSQISDNIFQVMTPVSSHFLIYGVDKCGLIDAGVLGLGLVPAVQEFLEGRSLDYVFLTHCDADHIGGIFDLKIAFPNLKVVAGKLAKERLANQDFLKAAYARNWIIAQSFEISNLVVGKEWMQSIEVDLIVEEGEMFNLGGQVNVKAFSFAGHTKEQVGYYIPSDKALAAGEAFGFFGGRDKEFPSFRFYEDYVASLNKVAKLDLNILSLAHNGVLTGEMVTKFIHKSLSVTQSFKEQVQERLKAGETQDEIFNTILQEWRSLEIAPEGPFVAEQKSLLKEMLAAVINSPAI
ncbi:MAG: MBL fold metallo-hydrolase [Deltaproteobacteria bacterium]|jgi:glyoxylase-like metal-dependent hydrolase (beta-lactamase superfamily II)|nr:MBL fold metallo-hydrolase [Deltaproteobacteria bacterium]